MPLDKAIAVAQIDDVLTHQSATEESVTLALAALKRLAPTGSVYLDRMEEAIGISRVGIVGDPAKYRPLLTSLHGTLKALRTDYINDRLQSYQEIIHAALFSDFLTMAEHFLEADYKDPAAVLAGSVLEEHLRKLCLKHNVTLPAKPKLDTMNADLARVTAYDKNDQKQITAWAGIRNDAAHGNYQSYEKTKIELMVQGIRDFIRRNPA